MDRVQIGDEDSARELSSLLSCLRIGELALLCEPMSGYRLVRRPRFIDPLWSLVWVLDDASRHAQDLTGVRATGWPAYLVWSSMADRWVMWDLGRWPRGEPPTEI